MIFRYPRIAKNTVRLVSLLFLSICALLPSPVFATSSSSYQIQEDFFGGGGTIDSQSPSFKAIDSVGGVAGAGDAAGNNYKTQTGAQTTNDPSLSLVVNTSSVNLGALTTSTTKTGNASFSVLNYTSYGYIVQVIGTPPNNGGYSLTGVNPAAASATNTEQFGMNLVANTNPATFGAAPDQVPNATFSFGAAASGYDTTNAYKYVSGDIIAEATKSSGKTTYTISYIANIDKNTPGGSYSANQTLVVTGTY